jgi:hypothetical protein
MANAQFQPFDLEIPECKRASGPRVMCANDFQVGRNAFEFFLDLGQWFVAPTSMYLHTCIIATHSSNLSKPSAS